MNRLFAILSFAGAVVVAGQARAGSIDYLSNESVEYIRTFSRNAATDAADLVNYNPAGAAFLRDGLYLNLSNQTMFKWYNINFDGKDYGASNPTPALPAFYAIYKWRHLAGFVAFTIPAGGGSLTYDSGIPYLIPLAALVQGSGGPPTEGRFEGSSMYLAPSFGAAYELFGIVSLSAVGRAIFARKSYKGSARYGSAVAELDSKKSANGFGGIFGVHVRPMKRLDIGIRYETETPLEFEAQTTSSPNLLLAEKTPLESYANGAREKRNLPSLLALGVSYKILEQLAASVSWNIYFLTQADSAPDYPPPGVTSISSFARGYNDSYGIGGIGMDLGASVEWRIIPPLLVSVGYNHSFSGGNERTYNDFEYTLSSNSVGGGIRYTLWNRFDINAAVAGTFYDKGSNLALHPIIAPKPETYSKNVLTLAVGLQYRFLGTN